MNDSGHQAPINATATAVRPPASAHDIPSLGAGRARFGAALTAAIGLHLAGLAAFNVAIAPDRRGQLGWVENAVGVTIVDARVLATRDDTASDTANADVVASIMATDGSAEPSRADKQSQATITPPLTPEVAPEILVAPQAEQAVDSRKTEPLKPDPTQETVADTTPAPAEQTTAALPTIPGAIGGARTHVTEPADAEPKTGAAAASPGAMSAYAQTLASALARAAPPAARGVSGQLLVRLVVSTDGSIDGAAITKSSGNARLDRSVVEAVEKVRLPAPPVGMTDKQRTYEMPYTFR